MRKITTLTMEIAWQDDGKQAPPEEWNWELLTHVDSNRDEAVQVLDWKVEDAE